jgi:vacuolar protein sorting-associated protein 45
MASFVEGLPEYSHQQGLTARHVALMSELSRAVDARGLMAVSGAEQEVVCQAPAAGAHLEAVAALVRSPQVQPGDKVRLAALYALRYERDARPQAAALLREAAAQAGMDEAALGGVRALLRHCPAESRVMDTFADRSLSSRFASLAKQHLKGVENVYTQHTPPLVALLERAARGKLADVDYPRAERGGGSPTAPRVSGRGAARAAGSSSPVFVRRAGGPTPARQPAPAHARPRRPRLMRSPPS